MGSSRIWPVAFRTVDGMVRNSIVVRVGCSACRDFFDVDLVAIRSVRGSDFSLLDRHCTCRRTLCRGRAYFIAAPDMAAELMTLVSEIEDPLELNGLTAFDLEPPPPGPGAGSGQSSLAAFVQQIARSAQAA